MYGRFCSFFGGDALALAFDNETPMSVLRKG
jgi:hypothetical protein